MNRNTKKCLAIALSALMCLSITACGGKDKGGDTSTNPSESHVTAQTLLDRTNAASFESADLKMLLNFDAAMDISALISDSDVDGEPEILGDVSTEAGGISSSMKMKMAVEADVQLTKQASHTTGTADVTMFGFSYTEPMETYVVVNNDGTATTYTYDTYSEAWTYVTQELENGSNGVDGLLNITSVGSEYIPNAVLSEDENGDYVVTGSIKASDMNAAMSADVEDIFSVVGNDQLGSDCEFGVTFIFDRETEMLKSMTIKLNPETAAESAGMEIHELSLSITISTYNQTTISVPDDVREGALEYGALYDDGDLDEAVVNDADSDPASDSSNFDVPVN